MKSRNDYNLSHKFTFVFNNKNTINNFLKHPGSFHSDLYCNVMNLCTCPSCQASYVGSTSQRLRHRITEHKGKSSRSGLPLSRLPVTDIWEHSLQHISFLSHRFAYTIVPFLLPRSHPFGISVDKQNVSQAEQHLHSNHIFYFHTLTGHFTFPSLFLYFSFVCVLLFTCIYLCTFISLYIAYCFYLAFVLFCI